MSLPDLALSPAATIWLFILAGVLANEVWRWAGVLSAQRIRADSEVFAWIKAVATALVAGVVAQIVFTRTGSLATVPMLLRVGALAGGFVAYLLARRIIIVGVLAGEGILVAGMALL